MVARVGANWHTAPKAQESLPRLSDCLSGSVQLFEKVMIETAADGGRYLLVIQLSDFHVRSDSDGCLARAEAVVAAVRPLARRTSGCVVTLTGDLTWSGDEGEFAAVTTFIDELRQRLASQLEGIPLSIALVPGNHDCDFSTDRPARDAVLARMSEVFSDSSL